MDFNVFVFLVYKLMVMVANQMAKWQWQIGSLIVMMLYIVHFRPNDAISKHLFECIC